MIVIADTREQKPFSFEKYKVQVQRATLPAGDYSIMGFEDRVAIERKELGDLIACLMGSNRERFERELAKAKGYDVFAVVVEASLQDIAEGKYRSEMKPHAALQSVTALMVRHRVPFVFAGNREGAEYMTHSILAKYLYEIDKRYQQAKKVSMSMGADS